MRPNAEILVIGGGSRIAALLADHLGDRAACVTRRPTGRDDDILVADYADVPPTCFAGRRCVVNCVGTSEGDAATLEQVNVTTPLAIARAARDAGVRHMIHISSFSVYGGARTIDRTTAERPTGDYGRSKLAADRALRDLATPDFDVTLLRLPLVYGGRTRGKLEQLIGLWSRLGILPVPAADVRRAMIGVDLSAQVVLQLIDAPETHVVLAADPSPFTYSGVVQVRPGLRRLPLGQAVTRLVERLAPGIGSRLFADSALADRDNAAIRYGLSSRLYRDIAAIAPL
ncbi:NAD-dependent epimerase/dehydratase family protein (plasmid) [Sphingomonas paucimobilis]|uniref:NAD-dependent epimerase/dehydratase family protein n=1 Tax=Sphingomonas TaxID=13687 RepID=UPI002435D3C7|nr:MULTISPECIES: NAD-dependent epimerase/dehydratase family protein [Sphingomonas]MDG5973019.1 NAD-dependent epimerase/dehydratase family protein [Sphingomonas paucimobilis]MDR6116794.1 nucleoside-diphosphate-sugar epimerase [Sphingomonas sp. SORGH_AS_0789]